MKNVALDVIAPGIELGHAPDPDPQEENMIGMMSAIQRQVRNDGTTTMTEAPRKRSVSANPVENVVSDRAIGAETRVGAEREVGVESANEAANPSGCDRDSGPRRECLEDETMRDTNESPLL